MSSWHGWPGPLHPPDREGIAQSLVSQVVTSSELSVHVIALQNLVQKVNVAWRQLKGLDLAQFVRGERWDYFTQWGEGFVQRLCPLALSDVGDHPLAMWVLKGWEISRTRTGDRRKGWAWGRRPMLRTPLESFRSCRGVDLDLVPWLDLAIICWCCRSNCGNLIHSMWACLPFMPGDPRCCYNDGTGIRRWPSFSWKHPSLMVVIIRLLLLSHSWPRFSSVFSLLNVTLYPSVFWIFPVFPLFPWICLSPLPLCFLKQFSTLLFVFRNSLCYAVFLQPFAVLFFFFNSYQLHTLSHPIMPRQNGWVISAVFDCRSASSSTYVETFQWSLPSLCECTLHQQSRLSSCPAPVAACETTATWIWLFKGRQPWNFQLPTHLTHLLVRKTFFGQLSLKQQEEWIWSHWSDQRHEAETKVCRTANQIEPLWRLLLVIEVAQVYRFQIFSKASRYHPPLSPPGSLPPQLSPIIGCLQYSSERGGL